MIAGLCSLSLHVYKLLALAVCRCKGVGNSTIAVLECRTRTRTIYCCSIVLFILILFHVFSTHALSMLFHAIYFHYAKNIGNEKLF